MAEGHGQIFPAIEGKFADYAKDPGSIHFAGALTDHTASDRRGRRLRRSFRRCTSSGGGLHATFVSSTRRVTSAGRGTGTGTRAPCAISRRTSTCRCLKSSNHAPKHRYAYAPEDARREPENRPPLRLYDKACFQTVVTADAWLENEKKWLVETDRGDSMTATYFVLACGRRVCPKLPGYRRGLDSFGGHAFHSSRWDYNYTGGAETGELTVARQARRRHRHRRDGGPDRARGRRMWAKELYVSSVHRQPSASAAARDAAGLCHISQAGWQKERRENFQKISRRHAKTWTTRLGWLDRADWRLKPVLSAGSWPTRLGPRSPTSEERECCRDLRLRVMNGIRARVEEIVKDRATAEALKPWYRMDVQASRVFTTTISPRSTAPTSNSWIPRDAVWKSSRSTASSSTTKSTGVDCVISPTGFEAGIHKFA